MKKRSNIELTVKEAANSIDVSTRSILNYIKSKEIEAVKVGKRWFIKEPSLRSFAKRYGLKQDLTRSMADDKENVENRLPKNKHIIASLRLYTISQKAFSLGQWININDKSKLTILETRLITLKLESVELIGAGYLSFNTLEKRDLYSRSRQKIGALLALLYSDENMQKKWSEEIRFIEEELLSAYSALIRKMETISEK